MPDHEGPGATWHDLAGDQQTRRGAAPARPCATAPGSIRVGAPFT